MKIYFVILIFFIVGICQGQTSLFFINPNRGLQNYTPINGQSTTLLLWQQYKMRALALDGKNRKIYWTDIVNDKILRSNLDGTDIETVLNHSLDIPEGIDIDIEGRQLFWMDNGQKTIMRMDLSSGHIEALIKFDLITLNRVKIAFQSKYIYWTEWGNNEPYGKVKRAKYDGTGIEELYRIKDGFIMGLAIDEVNGKVYWTDSAFNRIQRANLDGSQVETLIDSGLSVPNSIAIHARGNKIFWTELGNRTIKCATLLGTEIEKLAIRNLGEPQDLVLMDEKALAVEDIADNYSIYPNPCIDACVIEGILDDDKVEITDMNGRIISANATNQINTSALIPAMYYLKITSRSGQRVSYRKFIKM